MAQWTTRAGEMQALIAGHATVRRAHRLAASVERLLHLLSMQLLQAMPLKSDVRGELACMRVLCCSHWQLVPAGIYSGANVYGKGCAELAQGYTGLATHLHRA